MDNNVSNLIKNFEEIFYNQVYKSWRIEKNKAAKDIVGECYEKFRRKSYEEFGFSISEKNKKVLGSSYNADMALELNGVIKIIEESKGHYIDSCFLKRAMTNFADIVNQCIKNKIEVPYFILSCPTKMRNFSTVFNDTVGIFREDIQLEIKKKFKYFPLCKNGRIHKSKYFLNEKNCFDLDPTLINEEISFLNSIKKPD